MSFLPFLGDGEILEIKNQKLDGKVGVSCTTLPEFNMESPFPGTDFHVSWCNNKNT